ncbi:TonB-dependent receptor [Bizionia myxarmorum]|uniref:TonB-dependent receptor plug domain-containing protein n=1 Tax=Bizionia myxarmorum TaxID=291186 RepID=A0A5D0RE56_9FLAO|nr:TonB-dependent receptor [Bizionia myxarmorum]TYB78988.1 TonB-dependent receptor plug domain-containing protein [Bizionia myxarmorum]
MKFLFNNASVFRWQNLQKAALLPVILTTSMGVFAQEKPKDSTKLETLDEVLVRSVRVKADSPITHSNLSKEDIQERNLGQDIPILLNFLPSVVTTSDAGAGVGYTGIRVRGINAQSTNVTINGIPYNDAESLGTFWVNLNDFASSVESLQLQRGVGTSTNGSGAFGASVNVQTDAVSNEAYGEFANSFGSFNTRKHTLKFSTGLLNDHIEFAGRLSNIKSDGYIDRATSNLKSYFLQGSYKTANTLIKAITFSGKEITYQSWNGLEDLDKLENDRTYNTAGEYTDENGNIQFYKNEVDDYQQDHYQMHWNQRFDNNWSTNMALNYTAGRGYFEQYKEDAAFVDYGLNDVTIGTETIEETDLVRRRWLDNDFYVVNANANYKNNTLDVLFGGSYSYYDGDHFGEVIWAQFASNSMNTDRYYDSKGLKKDINFFGKGTFKLNDNMSLFADLQLRLVDYTIDGINSDRIPFDVDEKYSFFNPKAGINYKFNTINSLYFSYARANREPNRDDFENNADVKPEQLNDFELGWRHDTKNFRITTNVYYMLYNEQLVLTGNIDQSGNPVRTNSGDSYRLGLEVEAAVQIGEKWRLQPSLTWSSNKNKETIMEVDGSLVNFGQTSISFSPEWIASNALTFQPINNLQLTLLSKFVGEQFMSNTEAAASKLDSYFINDLSINYEIKTKRFLKSILFSGLFNNILNVKYASNGFYYTYDDTWSNAPQVTTMDGAGFYPQATSNFLLGMTLKF